MQLRRQSNYTDDLLLTILPLLFWISPYILEQSLDLRLSDLGRREDALKAIRGGS
jgi:hypothetical protein